MPRRTRRAAILAACLVLPAPRSRRRAGPVHDARRRERPRRSKASRSRGRASRCCCWAATAPCTTSTPPTPRTAKKTAKAYVGYSAGEMQALAPHRVRAAVRHFDLRPTSSSSARAAAAASGPTGSSRSTAASPHYMSVRGFRIAEPPTPLGGHRVPQPRRVLPIRGRPGRDARRPARSATTTGQSNRDFLVRRRRRRSGDDWSSNAETIIHEATHQTAYNVGVHARFAEQPRWVVEGLAMMFEAPGVWSAASLHTQADRINRYRLDYFRDGAARARRQTGSAQLVASDQPFETGDARRLRRGVDAHVLPVRDAAAGVLGVPGPRGRVASCSPRTRRPSGWRDFTAAFGSDLDLLAAQVERFVDELP